MVSNAAGAFRAQLHALGKYSVRAELPGFKTFEQQGISLSAGQTAVVNIAMTVGNLTEVLTVTSEPWWNDSTAV